MAHILNRQTGESHLQCESCPAQFAAPEPHMPPQKLKPLADARGWTTQREAAEWRHFCPACGKHRNRRLI